MGNEKVKPDSVLGIVHKENDSQNDAIDAQDTSTRKKFGPAASHTGGNPTSSGGINRPAKGQM